METNPTVSIETPTMRINLSQGMLNLIEFFDNRTPRQVAQSLENVFDLALDNNRDLVPDELQDLLTVKQTFKLLIQA